MTTTTTDLGTCAYAEECDQPAVGLFDDEIVGPTPICAAHKDAADEAAAVDGPPVDRLEQQARDLLAAGKAVQYICDLTGYSRARVEQLAAEVGRTLPAKPPAHVPAATASATAHTTNPPTVDRKIDSVDGLLAYAEGGSKRCQAAAKRLRAALQRLTELVHEEDAKERAAATARREKEQAAAEVRELEERLAAAKAKLRGGKTKSAATAPKKGRSWSPEQRAAASERMRQRNAQRAEQKASA